MPQINRHIITTDYMQMIPTRKVSTFLNIRQENPLSHAELYVMEDDTTPEVLKPIIVLTEKQSIAVESPERIDFIGTFTEKNNKNTFIVFELK